MLPNPIRLGLTIATLLSLTIMALVQTLSPKEVSSRRGYYMPKAESEQTTTSK